MHFHLLPFTCLISCCAKFELLQCLQTAVAVGVEPDNDLPYSEFYEYFAPDYILYHESLPMKNENSPSELERIR